MTKQTNVRIQMVPVVDAPAISGVVRYKPTVRCRKWRWMAGMTVNAEMLSAWQSHDPDTKAVFQATGVLVHDMTTRVDLYWRLRADGKVCDEIEMHTHL